MYIVHRNIHTLHTYMHIHIHTYTYIYEERALETEVKAGLGYTGSSCLNNKMNKTNKMKGIYGGDGWKQVGKTF